MYIEKKSDSVRTKELIQTILQPNLHGIYTVSAGDNYKNIFSKSTHITYKQLTGNMIVHHCFFILQVLFAELFQQTSLLLQFAAFSPQYANNYKTFRKIKYDLRVECCLHIILRLKRATKYKFSLLFLFLLISSEC